MSKKIVVQYGNSFAKDYKKLAKKYKSLCEDFKKQIKQIEEYPTLGILLDNNLYKIRVAIKSKQK